jgi:predicted transcriptional regulator of viral defense system
MNLIEEVKRISEENHGIIKTSDITSRGIHNRVLEKLVNEGQLVKLKRGIYQWVEEGELEDLEILVRLIPDAVIFLHSALFYHGYTDRTPDCFHIAVDRNCNKRKLKFDYPQIKPYFMKKEYLGIGIKEVLINEIKVKIFDKERTICDVLRYSNKIDKEVVNKAIQSYVNDRSKDINKLIDYSKKLNIYKKVQIYIGMWL